jgi:hypothetical protein
VCGSVETGRFTPPAGVFADAGTIGAAGTPEADDVADADDAVADADGADGDGPAATGGGAGARDANGGMFCEPFAADVGGAGGVLSRAATTGASGTPGGRDVGAGALVASCDPAGPLAGAGMPTGRLLLVIGLARGAPAGAGTMGRTAGNEGRVVAAAGTAGLTGAADAADDVGTAGFIGAADAVGTGGFIGAADGVGTAGFTAATPSAVGFGVETPVAPVVVGIGDDARAGGRTRPVGDIVCSTDGWAVVIEAPSSGISRSSARSRSSSSGGNTRSAKPFPPADVYARPHVHA